MKQLVTLLFLVFMSFDGFSQVGINTTSPYAQLDIRSSNQATPSNTDGILIPKIDAFPITSPGSDQHGMMVYLTTTDLGKLPGFYYWNNVFMDWISFDQPDYDFIESGSSTAPDDLNDNMYHLGDVGIGVFNPVVKLDVESSFDPSVIQARNIMPSAASYSTVYKSHISTVNQTNGTISAMDNYIAPNLNTKGYGILNNFSGNTTDFIHGIRNNFSNSGTGLKYGFTNYFDAGTGSSYGLFNNFNQTSTVSLRGVYNAFNNTAGTGNIVGVENFFSGNGSGAVLIGVNSTFSSDTNSGIIGASTYIPNSNTGAGTKYGFYANIESVAGGTHYGIFSQSLKSSGYAGYFLGRVAIGTTAANNYILPLTRGTANQIMQTDGTGNVTWQNPTTALNNFAWTTTGNSGTNPSTNFIGTIDTAPLVFKVNNQFSGKIESTSQSQNTFFGYQAGILNIPAAPNGSNNSAFGFWALTKNTTGYNNTAFGHSALFSNINGTLNIAIGSSALYSNTSGNSNVGIGVSALNANILGDSNVGIGYWPLFNNTSGSNNIAVGQYSQISNTTGSDNISIGNESLYTNSTVSNLVAIGKESMRFNSTGTENTAIGYRSSYSNTSGLYLVSIGYQSLYGNTTGMGNSAVGRNALYSNTIGNRNSAVGTNALYTNVDGDDLTAVGYRSLMNNSGGSNNVAVGNESLFLNSTGNFNTGIGFRALYGNQTGIENTAVGNQSLTTNSTGIRNSSLGYQALFSNTTGSRNCAFGDSALYSNLGGFYNTAIGTYAYFSGSFSNSIAIGDAVAITAGNQVRIGDGGVTSIGGFANWTNVSDERFKKDIQQNVPGLTFIKKLKPVTYHLDMDAIANLMKTPDELRKKDIETEKEALLQTGFIAQEVEQAAKEIGFDFSGIDAPKNETDFYGLRYAEFVVPLVKAVQEQQEIIEIQNTKIQSLEERLKQLEEKLSK